MGPNSFGSSLMLCNIRRKAPFPDEIEQKIKRTGKTTTTKINFHPLNGRPAHSTRLSLLVTVRAVDQKQ